jgi:hypothetical protein
MSNDLAHLPRYVATKIAIDSGSVADRDARGRIRPSGLGQQPKSLDVM